MMAPFESADLMANTVGSHYAVLTGGSNGDDAWRGLVKNVQLIDPRPYIFQSPVLGRLIYTVIFMSDRLLTQAHHISICPPHQNCVGWMVIATSKDTIRLNN
jgi:hypothetical protein